MTNTDVIYTELQKHLDKQAVGFPATESGVEIRILKELFTPEQASLALYLSIEPRSAADVRKDAGSDDMSVEEVKSLLDDMVDNGSIGITEKGGIEHYYTMPLLIGIAELHSSKATPQFLADFAAYMTEGYGKAYATTKVSQMRTIPVQQSLNAEHQVTTYDHVREIINTTERRITVGPCMCREGAKSRGEPCKVTSRIGTCMSFGDWADLFIKLGAREITREEALEIIRKNEEDGLVLQTHYRLEKIVPPGPTSCRRDGSACESGQRCRGVNRRARRGPGWHSCLA